MYATPEAVYQPLIFQSLLDFSLEDYIKDKSEQKIKKILQAATSELKLLNKAIPSYHPSFVLKLQKDFAKMFKVKNDLRTLLLNPELTSTLNIKREATQFFNVLTITEQKIDEVIEENLTFLYTSERITKDWDSPEDQHWDNY